MEGEPLGGGVWKTTILCLRWTLEFGETPIYRSQADEFHNSSPKQGFIVSCTCLICQVAQNNRQR